MTTSTAAATQLQSHCIQVRYGLVYLAVLGFVGGLMSGIIGGVLLSENLPVAGGVLLALAPVLLVAAVLVYRRGQFPVDVALTPAGLQLTPLGRALKQGVPAETVPLSSIGGYSSMEQYNSLQLKLYRTDGRVLTLADRPRSVLKELEPGFVPLAELSAALQTRLAETGSAAQARPNFFQGIWGQLLAGLCALCFVAGLVLMFVPGVEWTQALRLLTFSSIYLGVYWRNRRPRADAA
ncbi:hypothetical protein EJV47_07810 [Hymenobacter gummosus]|uniref:Uncharacterized protein n=1 Tax=Hymenobacter gummosus TaxID=1776032 RepID=A0A3S0QJM5_9BACT|nr:hypothetical protein [Hymenobacter gummosus]RTQ51692.1 hypothetical protein EJV47_07810 [Hymenobacter gummosus]